MTRISKSRLLQLSALTASAFSLNSLATPAWAQQAPAKLETDTTADIIVTAQKRSERLLDTPVPVTALTTESLEQQNQTRLQDYFVKVPGLSLNAFGDGRTNIVVRGIATAYFANPTVAVSIDDVPYGSSTALGGGQIVQPDLDPSDLQRIEVLRGPQGTLYGASSLGGLIKYVTADPSTKAFSGRVQADFNAVEKGELGFGLRGAINAPLSDTLALRVSAFERRTPGYIDNVATGQDDVNRINAWGGRAALLWQPNDTLTIKLGVLHQNTRGNGASVATTDYLQRQTLGDLNVSLFAANGVYRAKTTLVTGNIDLALGWADLKSVTGYGDNEYRSTQDVALLYAGFGPNAILGNIMKTRKFTEEVRLSSPTGQTFEWLIGGFYTHERSPTTQTLDTTNGVSTASTGNLLTAVFPSTYEEVAGFADGTLHLSDRFNVQAGIRYSRNTQNYRETDTGTLGESAPGVPTIITAKSSDNSITFLVTPQYKFSRHAMVYMRFASGYRPGGPNPSAETFGLPPTFDADRTMNYEIGLKGDAFGGKLTFDLSAYHIDWNKIQFQVVDPTFGFAYFVNGSKARSDGFEAAFQLQPVEGLHVAANGSYNVAELSENAPAGLIGFKDDRLPYSSRFSGTVSADQDIHLNDAWTGFVGGTVAYVGKRYGAFQSRATSLRLVFPSYTTLDLRLGARSDLWNISLFARNVTDKRGVLSSASLTPRSLTTSVYTTNFIQPRTIGVSVSRNF